MGKGMFTAGWEAPTLTCGGTQGYPQRPQEGSSFWRVETNGKKYHWTGGLSLRPPHSHLSHSFIHLLLLSFIHPANNYWEDTLSRTLEQGSGASSLPKCFSTGLPATNFVETDQTVMKEIKRVWGQ